MASVATQATEDEDQMARTTVTDLLRGAAAGAAGTTALNVVTYADMALRGRAASSTPPDTVQSLLDRTGLELPGADEKRGNRLEALGALSGLAAGVGTGVLLGGLRAMGWRPASRGTFALTSGVVLVAGNGPMTALGITDPRTWDANAWATDLVPHLAYAAVATYVLTNGGGD
jgi:hypothetical protein